MLLARLNQKRQAVHTTVHNQAAQIARQVATIGQSSDGIGSPNPKAMIVNQPRAVAAHPTASPTTPSRPPTISLMTSVGDILR